MRIKIFIPKVGARYEDFELSSSVFVVCLNCLWLQRFITHVPHSALSGKTFETHFYFPVPCYVSDLSNDTAKFNPATLFSLFYDLLGRDHIFELPSFDMFHTVQPNSNYAVTIDRQTMNFWKLY